MNMTLKRPLFTFTIIVLYIFLVSCSSPGETSEKKSVTVSAASSLQDVLTEAEQIFEKQNPEIDLVFNYGSSGSLKQQILQGAPVDIYFSASLNTFEELIDEQKILKEHSSTLLKNNLVLIENKNAANLKSLDDLLNDSVERIGLGTPESVPAGFYTEESLNQLNLLEPLESKIVYAKNVRQVLTYVENGDVQAGFVYKTDALTSDKVEVISEIDASLHSPILYPVGVTLTGADKKEVMTVYEFFQEETMLAIANKYGFSKGGGSHD